VDYLGGKMTRKDMVSWIMLLAVPALAVAGFMSCDIADQIDGPDYARGGKIKYLDLDSIQVLPPYTELLTYDATLGEPPDSTQQVQYLIVYWEGDRPNLKRAEDGLLYRVDMDAGCLVDRPRPQVDGSDVVLVVTNVDTGDASEPVYYTGVAGLPICAR